MQISPFPADFRQMLRGSTGEPPSFVLGLLGRGIGASLSPLMHEAEGSRSGVLLRYNLIDFDALDLADTDLDAVLSHVADLGFTGVNVTYPFKQAVMPLLDDLSADARKIGAVNTVVFRDGRKIGYNTDCWGFAEAFRQTLSTADLTRVVQIGAGGAGAAVAQALVDLGAEQIDLFDTDGGKAAELASRLQSYGAEVRIIDAAARTLWAASGVVNATPLGMTKLPGLPIDPELLKSEQWVADVIYFPRETELVRRAAGRGCAVMPGGPMAVYQAVGAYELFTGRPADAAAMAATFQAATRNAS